MTAKMPTEVDRGPVSGLVLIALALLALALVVLGAVAALDTLYTMGTTSELDARGRAAYHRLWWCAAGMVAVGAGYWVAGRSRVAAVLMGLAAAAAAVGLVGYLFVPLLTVAAIMVSVLRRGRAPQAPA